ncbi:MAG: hypothetical protein HY000_11525 [Planctomycetes bacterium]|nr:hypothetical protein [Planctomycetota bacterium]
MTIDQLRRVHQAKPFRPFTLQLADGTEVEVRHPEMMFITPGGRTVIVAVSDDAVELIDALLVAAIRIGNRTPRRRDKRTR